MRTIDLPGSEALASVWTWRTLVLKIGHGLAGLATIGLVVSLLPLPPVSEALSSETGYEIQLVIDRSGSMYRDDVQLDVDGQPQRLTRLAAVQQVGQKLLDGGLTGLLEPGDRIGLISFAGQARVDAEPTSERSLVRDQLRSLRTAQSPREDGTAIADALQWAVAGLQTDERDGVNGPKGSDQPESSLVILLTDGQQNAGTATLDEAEAAAVAAGVPVHIIGLRPSRLSPAERQAWADSDRRLQTLAEATGGHFFLLREARLIGQVFEAIGQQSRTEQPSVDPPAATWRTASLTVAGVDIPPLSVLIAAAMLSAAAVTALVGRLP